MRCRSAQPVQSGNVHAPSPNNPRARVVGGGSAHGVAAHMTVVRPTKSQNPIDPMRSTARVART